MGVKEVEDKAIMELIDFHNAEFKARIETDTSDSTFEKYEITKLRVSQFLKEKYQSESYEAERIETDIYQ